MASSGPNSGGTFANDTGVGTAAWSSTSNAASSNNAYAYADSYGSGDTLSNYLKVTGFGFAIPSGATIDGILVQVERNATTNAPGNQGIRDSYVRMVKGGTVSGSNYADTSTYWATSDTVKDYGGATDLWGLSWTDSDINGSTFGVAFAAKISRNYKYSERSSVDHIRITVYYTTGGGGGGSSTNAVLYIGN